MNKNRMSARIAVLALVTAMALGACADTDDPDGTTPTTVGVGTTAPAGGSSTTAAG